MDLNCAHGIAFSRITLKCIFFSLFGVILLQCVCVDSRFVLCIRALLAFRNTLLSLTFYRLFRPPLLSGHLLCSLPACIHGHLDFTIYLTMYLSACDWNFVFVFRLVLRSSLYACFHIHLAAHGAAYSEHRFSTLHCPVK